MILSDYVANLTIELDNFALLQGEGNLKVSSTPFIVKVSLTPFIVKVSLPF